MHIHFTFLCWRQWCENLDTLLRSQALCYLSVIIVPMSTIEKVLEMLWKVKSSESKKAKISMLEFTQVNEDMYERNARLVIKQYFMF